MKYPMGLLSAIGLGLGAAIPAAVAQGDGATIDLFRTDGDSGAVRRSLPGGEPNLGIPAAAAGSRKFYIIAPGARRGLGAPTLPPSVRIVLPTGKTVTCDLENADRGSGVTLWTGRIEGEDGGRCNLALENGQITGSVTTADGQYRIQPVGGAGVHAVIHIRDAGFPTEAAPRRLPGR